MLTCHLLRPRVLWRSLAVTEQASHGPVCRAPSTGLKHLRGPPSSVISVAAPDFYPVVEAYVYWLGLIFSHMSVCVCRWWAGEWEACSATCGPHGEKTRTVLCIQTMGSDEQALPAQDCQHLLKPKTLVSCNRDILCPSDWTVGNWSEVSPGAKRDTGVIHPSSTLSPILLFQIFFSAALLLEIRFWAAKQISDSTSWWGPEGITWLG